MMQMRIHVIIDIAGNSGSRIKQKILYRFNSTVHPGAAVAGAYSEKVVNSPNSSVNSEF